MTVLDLPRPDWMTEDVVLLEEQARRFIAAEFVPHLDRWHEDGIYDRDVWTKAGAAGLLCASMPEEYDRVPRQVAARGAGNVSRLAWP